MKDYSMNIEEQKDFICGYNITKDGKMIVKFATGKPWILPYNEENEQIVLKKMTVQVENSTEFRYILERKNKIQKQLLFGLCIISVISGILVKFGSGNLSNICLLLTPIIASAGLGIAGSYIKNNLVLQDLKRNKEFLEMQDKLNGNIRKKQNVLSNVSNKTKNTVKDFPEDKQIFNINSFNYVPYKDLEQIIENIDRNEKFGFNYTEEQTQVKTRKKTR